MKLKDHLMNLSKIYIKIIIINNKYLKQLLLQSKKYFNKINNNLINNSLQIWLIKNKYNKLKIMIISIIYL